MLSRLKEIFTKRVGASEHLANFQSDILDGESSGNVRRVRMFTDSRFLWQSLQLQERLKAQNPASLWYQAVMLTLQLYKYRDEGFELRAWKPSHELRLNLPNTDRKR